MKKNPKKNSVFFNASVILSGLHSSTGGSAKLINWSKTGKLVGIISELVFHEVMKHSNEVNKTNSELKKVISEAFLIVTAPSENKVNDYNNKVPDKDDRHVLASADEINAKFLVTLDKKHLLVLKNKIKKFRIVNTKELIEELG